MTVVGCRPSLYPGGGDGNLHEDWPKEECRAVYVMAVEANHFGNCDVIKSCSFLINIYIYIYLLKMAPVIKRGRDS